MLMNRLLLRPSARVLLCACLVLGAHVANAATAWNEAVSGDLANAGASPTAVNFGLGSNIIIGTTGRTSGVVDRDYLRFTLPAGWQLDTLTVVSATAVGTSALSFIAVQAGPHVTVSPTGGSASGRLGYAHSGENDVGTDILQIMGFGPGATGFSGALPAGSYSFWIQDTGTGVASYNLNFGVSAVPEPSAALMLLAGVAGLGWLRRRSLIARAD